jgi:hypothetical protein
MIENDVMIRARLSILAAIALLSASGSLLAQQARIAGTRPDCTTVTAQPIFNGSGYNHLVTITNGCSTQVSCTVTTDINPHPIAVTVEPGQSRTVNTYFNAAGYGFTPTVHCATSPRR